MASCERFDTAGGWHELPPKPGPEGDASSPARILRYRVSHPPTRRSAAWAGQSPWPCTRPGGGRNP